MVFPNKLVGKKLEKFIYSTRGSYPLMASPCFSRSKKKNFLSETELNMFPPPLFVEKKRKEKSLTLCLGHGEEGERREYS